MTVVPEGDYQESVDLIARSFIDGAVVPFLGAGVNLTDRPQDYRWDKPPGQFLPSGGELARYVARVAGYFGDDRCIARECLNHAERCPGQEGLPAEELRPCRPDTCRMKAASIDLAHVTQFLTAKADQLELYSTLRSVFAGRFQPTSAHRYLASLFGRLRARRESMPLVVTTNYDDMMEAAFTEAGQAFDLVFYDARRGRTQGRFFHVGPSEPEAIPIGKAYKYEFFHSYPVVLKIHGHVDQADRTSDSYVITEDDYIEYLANARLEQLLPATILARLRNTRLLFLGYSLRDWNLRVFLRRLAADQELSTMRWAVALGFSPAERRVWSKQKDFPIEIINTPMAEFIGRLRTAVDLHLSPPAPSAG